MGSLLHHPLDRQEDVCIAWSRTTLTAVFFVYAVALHVLCVWGGEQKRGHYYFFFFFFVGQRTGR